MPEKRRIIERARDVYDTAGERLSEAKERLGEARDRTRETIEEHPFTSVIVAAAIGAVVGVATAEAIRMIRRRNRR